MTNANMKRDWEIRAVTDHVKAIMGSSITQDEFWLSGEREYQQYIRPRLSRGAGDLHVVADWGCGTGRITRQLARDWERVIGIDVSPTMIKKAESALRDLSHVYFIESDGATVTYISDGELDAVVSWEVFIHLPTRGDVDRLLREVARCLRPGGVIVFTGNVPTGWMKLKGVPIVPRRLRWLLPKFLVQYGLALSNVREDRRKNTWRGAMFSRAKWYNICASHGLRIEEITPLGSRVAQLITATKTGDAIDD